MHFGVANSYRAIFDIVAKVDWLSSGSKHEALLPSSFLRSEIYRGGSSDCDSYVPWLMKEQDRRREQNSYKSATIGLRTDFSR